MTRAGAVGSGLEAGTSSRSIAYRATGLLQGPLTRLIDPDALGQALKPFALLHWFRTQGARSQFGLHPHSGIATLTYVVEGRANYTDPGGETGILAEGSVEWMKAGSGMWHAGGSEGGDFFGIQLWLALPPALELTPWESRYIAAGTIEREGPARILVGRYGDAVAKIELDMPVNILAVHLAAGERWRYTPPDEHGILWLAIAKGSLTVPDDIGHGEIIVFDGTSRGVTLEAGADTIFLIGSAAPQPHELVIGSYSIHTSPEALAEGERNIRQLGENLRAVGRI